MEGMKKLLAAMFVALLMVGCGTAKLGRSDFYDPATHYKILAEAIDYEKLQWSHDEKQEQPFLLFAPNKQTPYTGWAKEMDLHYNGQINMLTQFKDGKWNGLRATWWRENGQKQSEGTCSDGKKDGLWTEWYENGQKEEEGTYKDGKLMSAVKWKPNGEKCPVTNVVDGTGVEVYYNDDGTEIFWFRATYKDGKKVRD